MGDVHGLCGRDEIHDKHITTDGNGSWYCPGQHAECRNCDDRRCMACVFREQHCYCVDDCPSCCSTARTWNHGDSHVLPPAGADTAAWHAWRLEGIGGSDISAVVHANPWKSDYALWTEKVGFPTDDHETEAMEFGKFAEPMVALYVQDRTGLWVGGQQTWLEHPEHGWMRATLDGYIFEGPTNDTADAIGGLEIKATGDSPDEWLEEIPLHIECQVQWQMAVSGLTCVYLAVFHMAFGRPKFRLYIIGRNQTDIDYLTAAGSRFWQLVQDGTPPDIDGSESTTAALQRQWEGKRGAEVDMTGMAAVFRDLRQAQTKTRQWSALADRIKNVVRQAMGEATEAMVDGELAATWRPTSPIDRTALLAALDDDEKAAWSKFDLSAWAKKHVARAKPFRIPDTGPRRFNLKGDT